MAQSLAEISFTSFQAFVENKDFVVAIYQRHDVGKIFQIMGPVRARFVEHLLFNFLNRMSSENLAGAVQVYSHVKMIQATCDTFQIQCFFILQLPIVRKKPLTPLEQEVLH
jgi:hypothetical protein